MKEEKNRQTDTHRKKQIIIKKSIRNVYFNEQKILIKFYVDPSKTLAVIAISIFVKKKNGQTDTHRKNQIISKNNNYKYLLQWT